MTMGIEEFLKIASVDQKKLLFDLHDLAEKERKLDEKISRIYSSINTGIYSNGAGITVCEDEDDVIIISAVPREELEQVRTHIAKLLKKAVGELKMEDVGMIQRQYKNYVK